MRKNYVVCLCVLLLCGVTSSAFAAKKNSRKEIRDSLKKTEVDIRYLREKCNHWPIAAHVGVGFLDGDQSQKYNHIFRVLSPNVRLVLMWNTHLTLYSVFISNICVIRMREKGRMNITSKLMEATIICRKRR